VPHLSRRGRAALVPVRDAEDNAGRGAAGLASPDGSARLNRLADRDLEVKEYLARGPQAHGHAVGGEVEVPGWRGGGRRRAGRAVRARPGPHGVPRLADCPRDAPVIHFGGPLQALLFGRTLATAGHGRVLLWDLTKPPGAADTPYRTGGANVQPPE